MKNILITGSSGFIGSFLVDEAIEKGYEVFAGVRKTSSKEFLYDKKIHYFEMDFSSQQNLENNLRQFNSIHGKFDFIIHNAGITKAKSRNDFLKINFHYSQNFVNALIATNNIPQKFIYISSLAAFGPKQDLDPIKETDIPKPITNYGKSKLNAEHFLFSLKNFPFLIIRPAAVYGPRDRAFLVLVKMLRSGIEPYLGRTNQLLSFIYVRDLARVVLESLESNLINNAYFISDGFSYTTRSFNELARKHLKKKTIKVIIPGLLIKPLAFSVEKISAMIGLVSTFNRERTKEFQALNWTCDSSRLKNDLKFTTKYNLDSGLFETIHWYKKAGWLKS